MKLSARLAALSLANVTKAEHRPEPREDGAQRIRAVEPVEKAPGFYKIPDILYNRAGK